MKFEDGFKLDFDDVLIKPKRSTLTSRSGVCIRKEYDYLYSSIIERVVPLIAANMDTTGTFAMAKVMGCHNMQVCLHKHYEVDSLTQYYRSGHVLGTYFTIGIKEEDVVKLNSVKN